MPRTPAVAVITPTFNHERFIRHCIESVLGQTRSDWEMVIVDDGSTDATLTIAQRFSDPRIRIVSGRRRGLERLVETYGEALSHTTAPLVAVLEGDDAWPAEKLARQLPAFDDPDVVLSYGYAGLIDAHGCAYATYRRQPPGNAASNRPPGAILPYLLQQNFIVAPTVVVRRESLEEIGGFWQPEGIPYVDHPTWLRLALRGPFVHTPEVLGYWRRHPQQFTTSHATGTQPDNRSFLGEVLSIAEHDRVLEQSDRLGDLVASGPHRHARWAAASEFRLALLNGSWTDALRAARPLLRGLRPKWTALAMVGLASRIAGSDLEWIFRRTDRFSWPSRRHMRQHEAGGTHGES